MEYEKVTEKIIGCAYKVYNKMGFGFLESVYEKCMMIELERAGLKAKNQYPIAVCYDEYAVGNFDADIFVENEIIVELKSVAALIRKHEVQLVHYLTSTKKNVGLLINFGEDKVEIKRKVREFPKPEVSESSSSNPVNPVNPV